MCMLTEKEMNTKVCSKCREVKLFSEFCKDKSRKDGHQTKCKACERNYKAEYYAANPKKKKEYRAKYYAANPEKERVRQAEYRAANPEKVKESKDKYYAANVEEIKEYRAKWCVANPEKGRASNSNYRAAKLEAIPSWLTKEDWQSMDDINEEADRLTRKTGIKHEVDHIHPLQGKLVCGLHCPANLQILTRSENRSKSNKFMSYVES